MRLDERRYIEEKTRYGETSAALRFDIGYLLPITRELAPVLAFP
jgi:hypothetical protein